MHAKSKVKMLMLSNTALHKFHVIKGQNMRDQIMSDRKSKTVWSDWVLCIPLIFIRSLNKIQCMLKNVQRMGKSSLEIRAANSTGHLHYY